MIYITFSLLALSVVGIGFLFICKGLDRPIKNGYLIAHAFFLIFGLAIFLLGACFHLRSWPYDAFFSTLFYVLGAQISLWSIGITGEILGNLPHTEETDEFSRSRKTIGEPGLILSLVMVALVAFMSGNLLDKIPWSRDVGFIKQVSAETRLPEKPDWVTETVKSTDRFGKEIEVEIGVLWDPYRWAKASTEYVSMDDAEKVKFSVGDVIRNFQNDEKRPIIVVGTASTKMLLKTLSKRLVVPKRG